MLSDRESFALEAFSFVIIIVLAIKVGFNFTAVVQISTFLFVLYLIYFIYKQFKDMTKIILLEADEARYRHEKEMIRKGKKIKRRK